MMAIGTLIYSNINSADYGIYVLDVNDGDMPRRDYETFSVPGRNRDLHYDNGRYENIDRVYKCVVFSSTPYGTATDAMNAFVGRMMILKGYQRIESSLHPEHYKVGEFRGEMQPQYAKTKDAARFDLTFDCDSRKWLKSGEDEITLSTGTTPVFNPGTENAFPKFRLTGNGTVTIGGFVITVTNNPGVMILDCEIGDAYSEFAHVNYNQYVSFGSYELPYLVPEITNIAVTGFTSCKMTPRWSML